MDNIFLIILLISPFLFLSGLIKPELFSKLPLKNLSRKKISAIFLGVMLSSFVGFGLTTDLETKKQEIPTDEQTPKQETQVSSTEQTSGDVLIKRVVDGDTVETESGLKVRYIGIDTPETKHPGEPVGCFGEEATKKNRELVEGKEVRLEKDVSETDKYDRLLRYVWIGDTMINELLVREGYASSSTYPPDVKYQERFREAERLARNEGIGLWGEVCITPAATNTPTPKAAVKGSSNTATPIPTYVAPFVPPPTSTPYIPPATAAPTSPPADTGGPWSCNCSRTCTQMTSCDEAYFQLNNCGCGIRDGDNDGVPCENLCPGG